jgi:hypothetical protein
VADWWENPYKGGPMVALPGFPRPLYPPDAANAGKTPSVNGPDVEAYKRTVARAGRWPWQTFDRAYSNGFAHGTSGNVGESGVEGVQRQQNIDATGYIGKTTFNTLRSIRVPTGPNEGQMAMDAYAQSLLVQAWEQFKGKEPEPEPEPTQSLRQAAYELAVQQIGIKESPPNSNQTKFNDWYGMEGPWCAMFVSWCFEHAGGSPSFRQGYSYAYVPYMVGDARNNNNGFTVSSDVVAGDVVCFDWSGDGVYDHVGIFESWTSGRAFTAIEGNTSTSNDSDGGEVMRRTRDAGAQGTVFIKVKEP